MSLKTWLQERAAKRNAMIYARGYDWAAGRLLRGHPENDLWSWAEHEFSDDPYSSFDFGIIAALRDWRELEKEAYATGSISGEALPWTEVYLR